MSTRLRISKLLTKSNLMKTCTKQCMTRKWGEYDSIQISLEARISNLFVNFCVLVLPQQTDTFCSSTKRLMFLLLSVYCFFSRMLLFDFTVGGWGGTHLLLVRVWIEKQNQSFLYEGISHMSAYFYTVYIYGLFLFSFKIPQLPHLLQTAAISIIE